MTPSPLLAGSGQAPRDGVGWVRVCVEDVELLTCCSPQPSWRIPPETRVRPGRRWRLTGHTATQAHGSGDRHTSALLGPSADRPKPSEKHGSYKGDERSHTGSVSWRFKPSSHLLKLH